MVMAVVVVAAVVVDLMLGHRHVHRLLGLLLYDGAVAHNPVAVGVDDDLAAGGAGIALGAADDELAGGVDAK
eukprot:8040927-Alexandrium_andersonii.AAC.1